MSKIYEPKGRAREYSPLALNLYKGCTHGCAYCYVPRMLGRWNKDYEHGDCKPNVDFDELERSAKKWQGCGRQILLSFTGDPYCGVEPDTTTKALEILNRYGHKVAILTKGGTVCLRDLDLFRQFGDRIKVGMSLTFTHTRDSKLWEPGAALPDDRVHALRLLHDAGIKTWASFEPVVYHQQSILLLKLVSHVVDHVKIGKMNYDIPPVHIDWTAFAIDAVGTCYQNHLPFYIKKSLQPYCYDLPLNPENTDQDYLNL